MTGKRRLALMLLSLVLAGLLACSRAPAPPAGPQDSPASGSDLRDQAAVEATAIIQQAQATALVLQAQAQATALLQQAQAQAATPLPQATMALPVLTPTPGVLATEEAAPATAETVAVAATAEPSSTVELLGVGFGAEGAFITVNYRASPQVAQKFWPGVLSVTDEATGTVFNEVPLMPVIGPLIARPIQEGQLGYVMLVHVPPILYRGAQVTVVLADYTFEHVPVH